MIEIISGMFSKFGTLGVVITLVFYFIKNNPITAISASAIEMKLATKEKRFYVRMMIHIAMIIMYTIFFMAITAAFFVDKDIYSRDIFVTGFVISGALFVLIFVFDTMERTFTDIVSGWKLYWKWLLFILLFFHFLSIFILTAYYIGTQVYTVSLEEALSDTEKYIIIAGTAVAYMIISIAMHFTVIDTYLRFLELKDNQKFTLLVNVEGEKWYLFHPIEKDLYLLGDKALLKRCTKFSFIERKELLKEVVEIEH